MLAVLLGLLISLCGFLVDHFVHQADRLLASDFYTWAIAMVFTYTLLQVETRRRAALAQRMRIAAEVNHHIRNALTGVVFTAAVRHDPVLQEVLQDATARIDWVLNTVLPDGSGDLRWPVQARDWQPAAWNPCAPLPGAAEATLASDADEENTYQSTPRTGSSGAGSSVSPSS